MTLLERIMKLKLENPNGTELLISNFELMILTEDYTTKQILNDYYISKGTKLFGLKLVIISNTKNYLRIL